MASVYHEKILDYVMKVYSLDKVNYIVVDDYTLKVDIGGQSALRTYRYSWGKVIEKK
jgi:hypothetical protein